MFTYQINLIRSVRLNEKKEKNQRNSLLLLTGLSFAALFAALGNASFDIMQMRETLNEESQKLKRVEAEYKKYEATRMIVDKADIELLDKLQTGRIFWTKKLAAMALHLPSSYWINKFDFKNSSFNVYGYGYISPKQEQLITIDDYLNSLRVDSSFCDVFGTCYFNSTVRSDEGIRERVTFDYSALKNGAIK